MYVRTDRVPAWILEERNDRVWGSEQLITVEHIKDPLTLAILSVNILPLCSPKLRRLFHCSGLDHFGTPLWIVMQFDARNLLNIRGFGPKAFEELHGIMKGLIKHAPVKLHYYMKFDSEASKLFSVRYEE